MTQAAAFNVGDRVLISCVLEDRGSYFSLLFEDAESTVTEVFPSGNCMVLIEEVGAEVCVPPCELKAAP